MALRQSFLVSGAVALTLALTGCGSSGDGTPGSSDPTTPTAPSASTTPEPAEPSETVAPANGPVMKIKGIKAHAPSYWVTLPGSPMQAFAVPGCVVGTSLMLFRFPNSGLLTLDELAVMSSKDRDWKKRAERLMNVTIDGQPAFHVAGEVKPGLQVEVFGMLIDDERVTVSFEFANNESQSYRNEVVQRVLASAQTGS